MPDNLRNNLGVTYKSRHSIVLNLARVVYFGGIFCGEHNYIFLL